MECRIGVTWLSGVAECETCSSWVSFHLQWRDVDSVAVALERLRCPCGGHAVIMAELLWLQIEAIPGAEEAG